MILAVPKTKTKLYGDRSFAVRARRHQEEDSCAASAIEYRDYNILEYREYYYHCYYYL